MAIDVLPVGFVERLIGTEAVIGYICFIMEFFHYGWMGEFGRQDVNRAMGFYLATNFRGYSNILRANALEGLFRGIGLAGINRVHTYKNVS